VVNIIQEELDRIYYGLKGIKWEFISNCQGSYFVFEKFKEENRKRITNILDIINPNFEKEIEIPHQIYKNTRRINRKNRGDS
jgi:hypothetical protein